MVRVKAVLTALAAVLATVVVGSGSAQAAQGCNGSFLAGYVYAGGLAQVDVYLENGTTNCLVNRTRGDSWGQANGMGVVVSKNAADIPNSGSTSLCSGFTNTATRKADCSNDFKTWAGPVRIYAPSSCISFGARINYGGWISHQKWSNKHCG